MTETREVDTGQNPIIPWHLARHILPLHTTKLTSDILHSCLRSDISEHIYTMTWVYRGRSYKARFLDLFSGISQSKNKDEPPDSQTTLPLWSSPLTPLMGEQIVLVGSLCPLFPLQEQWLPHPFHWLHLPFLLSFLACIHKLLPLSLC